MPSPLINTSQELDAATAAAIESRREKLKRIAEGKGIRNLVAYAFAVIVALCTVAAFIAGDRSAARILAFQFCLIAAFLVLATTVARRKAQRELLEMSRST
jgi:Flp pilus assembly protein TadB